MPGKWSDLPESPETGNGCWRISSVACNLQLQVRFPFTDNPSNGSIRGRCSGREWEESLKTDLVSAFLDNDLVGWVIINKLGILKIVLIGLFQADWLKSWIENQDRMDGELIKA